MEAVADRWLRTRETSIEYRATSNAGAETPFRIGPNEMRKIYVMSGVPPILFEFVAIEAERVLTWLRPHGGKTPGEIMTGERADYDKYVKNGTFGCKVIARRPVAWRDSKHQPRAVEGVNLGRARNQPGWHIYTEEYGIMTSTDVTLVQHIFPFKDGTITVPTKGGIIGDGTMRLMGLEPPSAPGGDDLDSELQSSPGGTNSLESDPDDNNSGDELGSIVSGEGELDAIHPVNFPEIEIDLGTRDDAPPSRSTRSH